MNREKDMPQFDVTVAGLVILDALAVPVTEIPDRGTVDFVDQIRFTVAGPAGGTAVDCAKLGLRTSLVGVVGDDDAGFMIRRLLKRNSVNRMYLRVAKGMRTSSSIVFVRSDGERPAVHARGSSDYLWAGDFSTDVYSAKVFHMGGTGLLKSLDGAPTQAVLAAAQEFGCITTFDLVGARERARENVLMLLPHIDYFLPSVEEARVLSGYTDVDDVASFFLDQGVGTCVFTLGSGGAIVAAKGVRFKVPAHQVNVVDTTGCGDAFSAGFIAGLVRGYDWELSASLGNACAALVATGLGSDAGIRDWDQVWSVMKTWPLKAL